MSGCRCLWSPRSQLAHYFTSLLKKNLNSLQQRKKTESLVSDTFNYHKELWNSKSSCLVKSNEFG